MVTGSAGGGYTPPPVHAAKGRPMASRAILPGSVIVLLLASSFLVGCGQKGPLYFSDEAAATSAVPSDDDADEPVVDDVVAAPGA